MKQLYVVKELHTKLKKRAIELDLTLSQLIEIIIKDYFKRN